MSKSTKTNKPIIAVEDQSLHVEKYAPLEDRPALNRHQMHLLCNSLLGCALTVIDSTIPDPKQNKASKDVLKNLFWEKQRLVSDWIDDQKGSLGREFPLMSKLNPSDYNSNI